MSIEKLGDEGLLRFYENVREQRSADQELHRSRYRFLGTTVKEYAQRLRDEIDRRRLNCTPIDWQDSQPAGETLGAAPRDEPNLARFEAIPRVEDPGSRTRRVANLIEEWNPPEPVPGGESST